MSKIGNIYNNAVKLSLFVTEFVKDMTLYVKYCGVSPLQDANERRFYKLIIEAHAIEKGLSLDNSRPLFGKEKIEFLLNEISNYDSTKSAFPVEMALGAINEYVSLHKERNIRNQFLDEIEQHINKKSNQIYEFKGGLRHPTSKAKEQQFSPQDFIQSRFSNRVISSNPIPLEIIKNVTRIAQTAPSQCNRQASKAHFYQDPEHVGSLLDLQGGAKGFTNQVGNLFIITSDLAAWGGAQQRNQLYVDGALFSMTLIYALHAEGIASCPLNLAVNNSLETKIKHKGNISKDQRLIMMIAVGKPKSDIKMKAAASPRRPIDEILSIH